MVDTIWGQTALSSMEEGYKASVGRAQEVPQQQAKTSLLSSQAAEAKLKLEQDQGAWKTTLSERASIKETLAANPELDMSKLSDQIAARDKALQSPAAKMDIPLMQMLSQEKRDLQGQQTKTAVELQQTNTANMERTSDVLNSFLVDPTNNLGVLDSLKDLPLSMQGNINNLKKMFAPGSQVKIPATLSGVEGKTWEQLAPEEKNKTAQAIKEGNQKLTAAQKDQLALSNLYFKTGKQADAVQAKTIDQQQKAQDSANKLGNNTVVNAERERHNRATEGLKRAFDSNHLAIFDFGKRNDAEKTLLQAKKLYDPLLKEAQTRLNKEKNAVIKVGGFNIVGSDTRIANAQTELDTIQKDYDSMTAVLSRKDKDIAAVTGKSSTIPTRPTTVPAGSQYSPSTKTWWKDGKQVH